MPKKPAQAQAEKSTESPAQPSKEVKPISSTQKFTVTAIIGVQAVLLISMAWSLWRYWNKQDFDAQHIATKATWTAVASSIGAVAISVLFAK